MNIEEEQGAQKTNKRLFESFNYIHTHPYMINLLNLAMIFFSFIESIGVTNDDLKNDFLVK